MFCLHISIIAVQRQLIGMQEQTLQTVQQTLHQKLSVIDVTVKETLERAINFQVISEALAFSPCCYCMIISMAQLNISTCGKCVGVQMQFHV